MQLAPQYDDTTYEPSEKQIKYAQQLAQRSGLPIPNDALSDRNRCSAFIDEALGRCPPSERQIAFAETLAAAKNEELSVEVRKSAKAVSEYINDNQHLATAAGGGGPGGSFGGGYGNAAPATGQRLPTDKQLLYAAALARQNRAGLSYEMLSDRAALSRFIDQMRNTPGGDAFGGARYDPAQYPAHLTASMGAGMGAAAASAGIAGGGLAGGGYAGGALDDEMLPPDERGGVAGAAISGVGADANDDAASSDMNGATANKALDAEMDDLFGESGGEGEGDPTLFREGQIPF